MSWHFLQGQEAASWEGNSLDGAPDALLKLMPTPALCYSLGSEKDCCHGSRFGTMCAPSTDDPGAAELTLLQADSLAQTSATAGTKLELKAPALDCGSKWPASSMRFDHGSSTWRTSQACLIEGWARFLDRWPRWGLMRDGECWELPIPEARRSVSAPGLWPTLKASDADQYSKNYAYFERRKNIAPDLPVLVALNTPPTPGGYYGRLNPEWTEWLMGWPTGWTALDAKATNKTREWLRLHGGF